MIVSRIITVTFPLTTICQVQYFDHYLLMKNFQLYIYSKYEKFLFVRDVYFVYFHKQKWNCTHLLIYSHNQPGNKFLLIDIDWQSWRQPFETKHVLRSSM